MNHGDSVKQAWGGSGTFVSGQCPRSTEYFLVAEIVELILGSVSCGAEGKDSRYCCTARLSA